MKEGILEYLSDLSLYEEIEVKGKKYLLLHAGIADFDPDADIDDYQPEDFITEPANLGTTYYEDKTLIVGHVPTESGKIERGVNVIAIDCGAYEGGKLACLCLESGEEFYV
jgi:serine/threonine protein phosphatase 1